MKVVRWIFTRRHNMVDVWGIALGAMTMEHSFLAALLIIFVSALISCLGSKAVGEENAA